MLFISHKADLLGTNFLSVRFSGNVFILTSFLKDRSIREFLFDRFFSLSALSLCHSTASSLLVPSPLLLIWHQLLFLCPIRDESFKSQVVYKTVLSFILLDFLVSPLYLCKASCSGRMRRWLELSQESPELTKPCTQPPRPPLYCGSLSKSIVTVSLSRDLPAKLLGIFLVSCWSSQYGNLRQLQCWHSKGRLPLGHEAFLALLQIKLPSPAAKLLVSQLSQPW